MEYIIRGTGSTKRFLTVLEEHRDGYEVEITCVAENFTSSTKDYLPKDLMETCLRTGYLSIAESELLKRA